MGIKLKSNKGSIDLEHKGAIVQGSDGGYYIPSVDEDGHLSWTPTKHGMEVPDGINIKGPQGEPGLDGNDNVYVGTEEPTSDQLIWINPDGEVDGIVVEGGGNVYVGSEEPVEDHLIWINPEGEVDQDGLATKEYVDEAIAQAQLGGDGGSVNLGNYYTKKEVDEAIENIEHPTPDLTGYATESFVTGKIAEAQLGGDGATVDLSGYYTKDETDAQISKAVNAIEHPTTDLSDYYTKVEVDHKIPSLEGYAKISDIPDVSGFTTMAAVEGKGYQTATQVNTLIETALGVIENGTY